MTMFRLASLSLLLLFGCNDSSVPLGPVETAPMDPALAGVWEPVAYEPNAPEVTNTNLKTGGSWKSLNIETDLDVELLVILPFNEHEYYLSISGPNATPIEEVMHMRGFITPLEDVYFANLQMLTDDIEQEGYMIFQFDLSNGNDILTVKQVDHDMDHIKTSEELRSFVKDILARDAFDKDDIYHFRKIDMD